MTNYSFSQYPMFVYSATFHEGTVVLQCFFHVIVLKVTEFDGLLMIGKLDRVN